MLRSPLCVWTGWHGTRGLKLMEGFQWHFRIVQATITQTEKDAGSKKRCSRSRVTLFFKLPVLAPSCSRL